MSYIFYLLIKLLVAFFVLKLYIFIAFKIINYIDSKKNNKESEKNV